MDRAIPNLIEKKEFCCGCGACYSICPSNAIQMIEDEEGFEYPVINDHACTRCYLCIKTCIFKKEQENKGLKY